MSKFSSGLVNYVESANINGYKKTVFYSDFATNLVVGDKVFIINGNYDSDLLINSSNFASGTDGYTVIDIDRCRITLDIDYTGVIPSNIDTLDNYIKVYNVTSQREFDYINTLTTNSYSGHIYSKFEKGLSNNIIYANSAFIGGSSVIDSYNNVSFGFYQKVSLLSGSLWTPISLLGTSSIPFTTTGSPTYSLSNNGKLLIVGKDDIIIGSTTFKSRGIYSFDNSANKWKFDILSNKPYISKLNFRKGRFNGMWNDGIYGTYLDEIDWYGDNATWNSGIFINSNWKNGYLYSKTDTTVNLNLNSNTSLSDAKFSSNNISTPQAISAINGTASRTINYNTLNSSNNLNANYYCKLNSNGLPIQTSDYSNNNGHGFNYIIDSNISKASIINGNFKNCNIGLTNYGINTLDIYYGLSFSYSISSKGGYYELCDINTALLTNSFIKDSNISNSNINNGRLSSNQIDNTVAQVTYNSDNGITVLNADLWSYLIGSTKRGVLKLFISDDDLSRLQDFEVIYIDKINKELYLSSFNDENKVYLNLENKYIFDYFNNSELASNPIIISRKNVNENLYKTYISYSSTTTTFNTEYVLNGTKFASIDIDLGNDLAYYKDILTGVYTYMNPSSLLNVNNVSNLFSNIVVSNSSFNSGLLVNSNWESGNNFNDIANRIKLIGNNLYITFIPGTTNSLYVNISNNTYNQYDLLNIGDYIWLDGIDYTDPYSTVTTISGAYKILFIDTSYTTYRQIELIEVTNVLNSLTSGGTFSVLGVLPNYVSINKTKIDKSNIQSGLFKSTLITNSKIFNSKFDNTDQNLTISNINRLRFINVLVNKNNNLIQSGYFYKSHIINANWQNAISYNNIWAGATFSNGVFNDGYWLNGGFDDGYLINSDDISTTSTSYDDSAAGYYRSWRYGTFNNGQFYKSTWIDGIFNNGRFFNSHWYGGIFNNGILGLKNTPYLITTMGYYSNLGIGATQTYWNNGVVESAVIGGSSSVYWYQGSFNDGEFTSFGSSAESIWYNGVFSGGRFDGLAKWKNGTFNNGKFASYYGFTLSNSTQSSDYSWENGIFSGGQFGIQNTGTNSTWFNGQFNGGQFYGKVWNYGIFTNGQFSGSSLTSSYRNEANFVNSFTNSYYGLWRDGYVVPQQYIGNSAQKVYTNILRATDTKKIKAIANIQNALWLAGTFSHDYGTINNSVWLDGSFISGEFNNSSFNPFVDRTLSGSTVSLSFNFNDSCKWINGKLNNSAFYISEWKNGVFNGNINSGYMLGGIWRNGTWFYGTAENIYWEAGTWKNGNWYGTNFDTTTVATSSLTVNSLMAQSVIYNVASASNSRKIHLLNAFTGSSPEVLYDPVFYYESIGNYNGWTQSHSISLDWVYSTGYSTTTCYGGYCFRSPTILGNYYKVSGSGASELLYGLKNSGGFTTSIFTDLKPYTVKITLNIDSGGIPLTSPVRIDVNMGNATNINGYATASSYCPIGTTTIIKTYTQDDINYWTSGFTNTKFSIQKIWNSVNVTVTLLSVHVNETLITYNNTYNNNLYTVYGSTPSISATLSLPSSLVLLNEENVGLQYGNGLFKSGVWENGVWENGYRSDSTLRLCDLYPISSYIKMSQNVHRVQLQFVNNSLTQIFAVGDSVSAGNLIAIDVNNNRKLLKDKFKVVYVDANSIVLEYIMVSPILEITKDSSSHLIYISKNVWLSGIFLSGYFNGIWNYGLTKGYPYITKFENSHWIDGIFSGGHFKGYTGSATYSLESSNITYNTGLIQNFEFHDNNIATANNFTYQSWVDVNYSTQSQVNLNNKSTIFSTFISGGGGEYPYIYNYQNIYGSPTYDILSSNSYFKIGNNNINYTLGNKLKIYNNFIADNGNFENPASSTNTYVGLDNLLNNSWTYSNTYGTTVVESNMTDATSELLNLQGGELILTNTNVKLNAEPDRYYMVNMTFTTPKPATNVRILNTSYNESIGWAASPGSFNHALTSLLTKTEYFYNMKSFDVYMYSGLSASITNISFYEVDKIPFFRYATESNIDQTVYQPLIVDAPYIDYTNANYNYINNSGISIDMVKILNNNSVFTPANAGNIFANTTNIESVSNFFGTANRSV
jgi:hypothetical protein